MDWALFFVPLGPVLPSGTQHWVMSTFLVVIEDGTVRPSPTLSTDVMGPLVCLTIEGMKKLLAATIRSSTILLADPGSENCWVGLYIFGLPIARKCQTNRHPELGKQHKGETRPNKQTKVMSYSVAARGLPQP